MLSELFNTVLYQPILNVFVGLYNFLPGHDVGLVILVITILIRLAVYPLTNSSIKAQRNLQGLQPKLEELKKQHKGDQQAQAKATMELYKNNKVNPFSSCLPILVQLPILIALYMVMREALVSEDMGANLYSFIANPGKLNSISMGFINMANPAWYLAVLAAAAQFWQAKTMMATKQPPKTAGAGGKDESMMASMNKQMKYMMPALTLIIGMSLPAGLTLYWFFSTLLMALQQVWIGRNKDKKDDGNKDVVEGEVIE